MKPLALLSVLFLVAPATGQQHAPTVAQCRADATLWGDHEAEVEYMTAQTVFDANRTPNQSSISKLGLDEINARAFEMNLCGLLDQARQQQYFEVAVFYASVKGDRESDFIRRHNLWDQFKSEDAQGKR